LGFGLTVDTSEVTRPTRGKGKFYYDAPLASEIIHAYFFIYKEHCFVKKYQLTVRLRVVYKAFFVSTGKC
jgi:hypothetical protein